MKLEDLKAHWEAEEAERAALAWYIRIPLNIGDFLWYRVIRRLEDIPFLLRMKFQKLKRGFSDEEVWNFNSFIIDKAYKPFKEFYRYQSEEGKSLPAEFETDPAAWLEILGKVNFAIEHEWREANDPDFHPYKNFNEVERKDYNERLDEGFMLFGKYLRHFWD